MTTCDLCGCTEFYLEAGFYFCEQCKTQNDDIREEVLDVRIDLTTKYRKHKIRKEKNIADADLGWTTWEIYNIVLIGLVDELIQLGVSSDIKITVLQLWATYLGKNEVAFISTKFKTIPKLAKRYNSRDAEIIYGRIKAHRRSKRKKKNNGENASMISGYQSECSSRDLNRSKRRLAMYENEIFMASQSNLEDDAKSSMTNTVQEGRVKYNKIAKEEIEKLKELSKKLPKNAKKNFVDSHVTTSYKIGPQVITATKLWSIIYIALRIHNESIQLGDMLRFGKEGQLSYYKLNNALPSDMKLTRENMNMLTQNIELTHRGMRQSIAIIATFLNVHEMVTPDFECLINRYCEELNLPRGIALYAVRLTALLPPQMTFNTKKTYSPNYEGRAMAYIIIVLKMLFALDDITEKYISRVIEYINSMASEYDVLESELFNFEDWQRYIECRKSVLVKLHLPTKLKYYPDAPDGNYLYTQFVNAMQSKDVREEPEITSRKHILPEDLCEGMKRCINQLTEYSLPIKEPILFSPSLTPLTSYARQIMNNPMEDYPATLTKNFYNAKIGYMTRPKFLQELAKNCGIRLEIVDSSLHFMKKIVPSFAPSKISTVKEFKEEVIVNERKIDDMAPFEDKSEDFMEYLHSKTECQIAINNEQRSHYEYAQGYLSKLNSFSAYEDEDFVFDCTSSNGQLLIPVDEEYETQRKKEKMKIIEESEMDPSVLKSTINERYNIQLSTAEVKSIINPHTESYKPFFLNQSRDVKGKFKEVKEREKEKNRTKLNIDCVDKNDILEGKIGIENGESENSKIPNGNNEETFTFYRPVNEYWMYHCVFSRVKHKNFEEFQKNLPLNFRWLLNECARTIEMTVEDLYEEVCTVEVQLEKFFTPRSIDKRKKSDSE